MKSSRLLTSQSTKGPVAEKIESILLKGPLACLTQGYVFVSAPVRQKASVVCCVSRSQHLRTVCRRGLVLSAVAKQQIFDAGLRPLIPNIVNK